MNTESFTNSQFNKLKTFDPGYGITHCESKLYIIGSRKGNNPKLFKEYCNIGDEYFCKKLYNLNILIQYKSLLKEKVPELIAFDSLGIVGGQIKGAIMPFIENSTNLELFLKDNRNFLEDKLQYLRKIGEILEKIKHIDGFPHNFFLCDLHEANFIIDSNGNLMVCDLDSACFSDSIHFNSKYLFLNPNIDDFPTKYRLDDNDINIPSRNTDIFCYIIILLNTLSNTDFNNASIQQFYNYMNYLEDLHFPIELLNCIEKIYRNCDNENPLPYLDMIPMNTAYQAHHLVYSKRTGRSLTSF